jgi:hypothetical protein
VDLAGSRVQPRYNLHFDTSDARFRAQVRAVHVEKREEFQLAHQFNVGEHI